MKKIYISPEIIVLQLHCRQLLSTSGVTSKNIGYGGVDEDGLLNPEAKGTTFFGDEEW
ncbi:MAG: hypothetical protein IK144_00040 [Bacteroidaceae bacterium]|nr:hypothetical protein [Bacteroidaceae bacterium]